MSVAICSRPMPALVFDSSNNRYLCRSGCGACCIALSISSPIPGMPAGKPAGTRCVNLTAELRCAIFDHPDRPEVCGRLRPLPDMCGTSAAEAMTNITRLEAATAPRRIE